MNRKTRPILPVRHAWVKQVRPDGTERSGRVKSAIDRGDQVDVTVAWHGTNDTSTVPLSTLRCGFRPMMEVQDLPASRTRKTMGEGVVLKTRTLGGRDQVLVDFPQAGKQLWLPYENLKQIKGSKHRFILGDRGPADSAERFRLKSLAHALEMWNENTGSLSHLEIDPLPHQIHLVHHILASGNLNWLIADDVGLGKTIETGMLLAALKQRDSLKRVLLVTPAGLTKQWQDELNYKFKMGEFLIYGDDFHINEPRHWKMYDYVIASMDRLKEERHLEALQQAGGWDLIVFDEAHRLSRRQYGMKLDASQRFQLAAQLRHQTDAMVLLTATPHQGMQDKFQALLELLRPERKEEITTLALNPEIIGDMVFRNNKADVTDADGNFIFNGKTTRALTVAVSEAAIAFDETLQDYLRKGYAAGAALGFKGNAIGFVMTVYRKLAASSVAAIHNALINRRTRLQNQGGGDNDQDLAEADQRFAGEWEEQLQTEAQEFFDGELELLDALIDEAERLRADDRKLQHFLDELIETILAGNPDEKVLIFSEYRSTQSYLKEALEARFGAGCVEQINGSMPHPLRRQAIARFEESAQFLISTEAGGEGINLQRNCHIMANYDLPWNPMRLVQRIGRLYRYGQRERVVVFNIHSPDTADERIMEMMYSRIDQVVADLAGVSPEYNPQLHDDILGEVADLVDVTQILEEATTAGIDRTQQRIDEALARAKAATKKQHELFEHAASFDPNETRNELRITAEHGEAFVIGMFRQLGIEILDTSHNGRLWQIRLPEAVQTALGIARGRHEVTLDRILAVNRPNTHMLDLDSYLMRYLLQQAKSYDFMGLSAVIRGGLPDSAALITSLLRWQNDQGQRRRQEYTAFGIASDGRVRVNPEAFGEWLKQPAETGEVATDRQRNECWFKAAEQAADRRLAEVSNRHLHPENMQWISGAWVE
ncbi:helicase domain-containing protein [Thiorhodococcus drewsii AZ1]|uniref:Helicase domain-containing protein n=1 Tax=Thiorhodococcus drewsii AZ1 TaxID=765913 RepID=G2E6T3_9GAMM|nr:helicase-related protein [Thiorhodococcus drewsii]EGV28161.1 helicase domain-containing protein [Thiorhodococcus drewsii AZ1]